MSYTSKVLEYAIGKNPNEPEFQQALTEIIPTLQPVINEHPEYEKAGILERLVEPERQIVFRVPWVDDTGKVQVKKRHGEAKNSWLTGTAAWNFVAISQYILGIIPDYVD